MRLDSFDRDVRQLGALSQNHDTKAAFEDLYLRVLTDTYNDMVRVANTDKVLAGEYTSRARILETLLRRQCAFFGMTWPAQREKAVLPKYHRRKDQ